MATRTLPSSRRARPFELPFDDIRSSVFSRTRYRSFALRKQGANDWYLVLALSKLLANVQDALQDGEPGRRREQVDRPLQRTPRREDEAGGDDDDALGARAQADVAAQAESLRLRPRVRDEEGAGDGGDREDDAPCRCRRARRRARSRRAQRPRRRGRWSESRKAPNSVDLPPARASAPSRMSRTEPTTNTAAAEPVVEELVSVLEGDDHRRREAERDARRRERRSASRGCVQGSVTERLASERAPVV